ncbi:MAG: class I SAM-dependent methyltransferase [Deltaproteobacteria bacterium]|nr:class I SAM-dependent methyltransferase [Deltaproteobacteria bacterium]
MATNGNSEPLTYYEQNQSFNAITSWLHSLRYRRIVNVFRDVARRLPRPIKVTDIGCAHAKLFAVLDAEFSVDYIGVDVDKTFASIVQRRYGHRPNFRFVESSALDALVSERKPDVVVALETCENIPEHDVVRLIEKIAELRPTLFVCSVPVEIGPAIWAKNVGSWMAGYVRHTEYTWRETFWAGLYQLDRLPPHETGHKGFDWRWLAQTVRHNMRIKELWYFPSRLVPAALSTSVFIVAEPR